MNFLEAQTNEDEESHIIESPIRPEPILSSPRPKKKSTKNDVDPRLEEAYQAMKASLRTEPPDNFANTTFKKLINTLQVFRQFESPAEISKLTFLNNSLHETRIKFLETLVSTKDKDKIYDLVSGYETFLRHTFAEGLHENWITGEHDEESEKWTTLKAVFFSSTVLTTIGYGNIVPMTTEGRSFCIAFALVGIPLTLTVIADWGRLFASSISVLAKHLPPFPKSCRKFAESSRTSYYALAAVCFLFLYLAAGAGLFVIWEEDWTFFDGFYFCFVTMTTIGFGDLVPKKPKYMLLCTLYILIGLALTSTIIELVRRQYAQSWRQLQALSGPLAENLRKLAENAPGLDVTAFQQDLRKVLTVITMPRKGEPVSKADKKLKQKAWEDAMEAVIRDITQGAKSKQTPLVQIADEEYIIQLKVEHIYLPCDMQWLKVRDGSSLSATLLDDLKGYAPAPLPIINSTGSNLLLEFESGSFHLCGGNFVVQAMQTRSIKNLTVSPITQEVGVVPLSAIKLTAVHIAAIFFLSGLIIATMLLGAQYLFRYRKYQIAKADDQDSLADNTSCATQPITIRASSNSTLLSEVISLTRLRPHIRGVKNKHSRLRESQDCENATEKEATLAKEEDTFSITSSKTLTPSETATTGIPQTTSEYEVTSSLPTSPVTPDNRTLKRSSTILTTTPSEKDKTTEKVETPPRVQFRKLSNVSNVTLTNGHYSPAANLLTTTTTILRSTNPKENKDKRNREKLLAGPVGSEFSLAGNDVDLEMDYYDYNVVNAGAAPGSYLGMDPAFLVWIPPLDDAGEILPKDQEARTKQYMDPKNESPEQEVLLPKMRSSSISESTKSTPLLNKLPRKVYPLVDIKSISNDSLSFEKTPLVRSDPKVVSIQLQEFTKVKLGSPVRVHREKETKVEKSPCVSLDEIKFADEDEDTDVQCNIPYQDSNMLSSS
ncbi:Ion channel [Popillia japonica]|uniref:Ion channel n=1 Tax=Popillia japonica TaxID=7064 RepID=A0AAW1JL93_POPJA